jgi:MFS family permease
MFISNGIKIIGCAMMYWDVHPLLAYAVVGLGAAAYSPAKYGILTEYLPHRLLVVANGWIEGLTVGAIILGVVVGGTLIQPAVASSLLTIDFPVIDTGVDSIGEMSLCFVATFYLLARAVQHLHSGHWRRSPGPAQESVVSGARVQSLPGTAVAGPPGSGFAGGHDAVLGVPARRCSSL